MALLEGVRSVIVGVGLGMGRSIALSMAREGAVVGLISRSRDRLERICGEVMGLGSRCYYEVGDAEDPASIGRAASSITSGMGGVDVLVYNAGGWFSLDNIDAIDEDYMLGAYRTNILGFFNTVKAFLREVERSKGVIIAIAASPKTILAGNVAYAATKGGLVWMTKRLAKELAPRGVRVVCVGPGPTLKDPSPLDPQEPQLLSPEPHPAVYVGEAVVAVASRKLYRLTGECIAIDGGLSIL